MAFKRVGSRHACKYLMLWCVCFYMLLLEQASGHIIVYSNSKDERRVLEVYNDQPAIFGGDIPPDGMKVYPYGVNEITNPQGCLEYGAQAPRADAVIIIPRGECTFETKVRLAQAAKYVAAIVYNDKGEDLETMSAANSTGIRIPSVFVANSTGGQLLQFAKVKTHFIINDELPFNINTQLMLPASIVIVLCFLIMIFYLVYKCIREQRRIRRYRLPKRMLKKLPILVYSKTNTDLIHETCVICLEDFADGDKLRVLPCKHPYHSHCIDPWLTENKRVCPICKRKVFTKRTARARPSRQTSVESNFSDSESDTTPLLQQRLDPRLNSLISAVAPNAAGHGTFASNRRDVQLWADGNENATDDENILLANSSRPNNSRRLNPFDRDLMNTQSNLPAQEEAPTQLSLWARLNFHKLLRRETTTENAANEARDLDSVLAVSNSGSNMQPTPAAFVPVYASNNILNPNLSGSFKDDDDEPLLPHRSIYEPIGVSTPSSENNADVDVVVNTDSAFLLPPTRGNIGVVALPNADIDTADQRNFIV